VSSSSVFFYDFQLLLTFGLILVLEDFAKFVWGVAYKTVSEPELLQGIVPMLGAGYPRYNLSDTTSS
jgi:branched-subunit amino acid ABC-type transport system permease component